MTKLRFDSNVEWISWGKVDPLWGVASWQGKKKKGASPWTDKEFYKLGESDWQNFLMYWKKYGMNDTSCLEIGCGAGRITMHLAKSFRTVHAVDVSQEMIAYAQERIQNPSVTFHLTEGADIPLPNNSVNAVFSTHVFQHFDSLNHASAYFAEIFRVLAPGGSMMIHLPIYTWPTTPGIFEFLYQLIHLLKGLKIWMRRRLIILGLSSPIMRSISYPLDYLYKTLPNLGFIDMELLIFTVKSNNGLHPLLLAHKATDQSL